MAVAVTVGEVERAAFEVREFIDDLLREYVAKVPGMEVPPLWDLAPVWPPQYYPRARKILIPEQVALLWAIDKELTKTALRWAGGHEFWHYVQEIRGIWGIPILDFPAVAEYIANKQAVRLSGVTTAEGMRAWELLLLAIYRRGG